MLNCNHVNKREVLLICLWFGLCLRAVFGQCFNSTFKKVSFSFLLGIRHNRESPQNEANIRWPGQPYTEMMGAEFVWQAELQRQKGENYEKIQ